MAHGIQKGIGLFVVWLIVVGLGGWLWVGQALAQPYAEIVLRGKTMGTTWMIRIVDNMPQTPFEQQLRLAVERELDRVEDAMSNWREDSEVSRFNALDSVDWIVVSPRVTQMALLASFVSGRTDGLYDITVSPLVDLWGFGPTFREDRPSDQEILNALKVVGSDKLLIDSSMSDSRLRKLNPGTQINFSSIAKGMGVDVVAQSLQAMGVTDFLVEIGGEIRAHGFNRIRRAWRVGIEQPTSARKAVQAIIALSDAAMATSGSYRHYRQRDDGRDIHIVNPKTGYPSRSLIVSATVVVPIVADESPAWHSSDGGGAFDVQTLRRRYPDAAADAWATAFMLLPPERSLELAKQEGLAVQLLLSDQSQRAVRRNRAFEMLTVDSP